MTGIIIYILPFIVLLSALYLFANFRKITPVDRGAFSSERVLNIAHRGGVLEAPENTTYAFKNALKSGADVIEMDIHASKDGVLFVFHDNTLERTTDGNGPVSSMTWSELQKLDAAYFWNPDSLPEPPLRGRGIKIPALEEIFREFPDTPMILEIKADYPEIIEKLGNLLKIYNRWQNTIVASFNDKLVKRFRKQFPGAFTSSGRIEVALFYFLQIAGLQGLMMSQPHSFQIPEKAGPLNLLNRRMSKALRKKGIDLHVWTVNEEQEMRRIINKSVDGILTNRVALLKSVIDDHHKKERD